MRIKQICMMVLLALGVAPWANAQTFDKLWKQVDQAEQKSLPQTVIQLTNEIIRRRKLRKTLRNAESLHMADEVSRDADSR